MHEAIEMHVRGLIEDGPPGYFSDVSIIPRTGQRLRYCIRRVAELPGRLIFFADGCAYTFISVVGNCYGSAVLYGLVRSPGLVWLIGCGAFDYLMKDIFE